MATVDLEFQKLCKTIKEKGRPYFNKKREVERLQIPSYTFRHEMSNGFPAITSKKLPFKFVKGELIWFLRGDNEVTYLNENGIDIWNKDAWNWHKKEGGKLSYEEFSKIGKGSVGQNYSKQWRDFNGNTDQIEILIQGMKDDIMSSQLKVEAWNPSELKETALAPCHTGFQIIGFPLSLAEIISIAIERDLVTIDSHLSEQDWVKWLGKNSVPEFGFELHWNQRSVDTFLGLPFNIASYALLGCILEEITGYPFVALEGALKCVHFYDNQYEAVDLLLSRNPNAHGNCQLKVHPEFEIASNAFKKGILSVDEYFNEIRIDMFKLENYTSDEEIKVEMLAPLNL